MLSILGNPFRFGCERRLFRRKSLIAGGQCRGLSALPGACRGENLDVGIRPLGSARRGLLFDATARQRRCGGTAVALLPRLRRLQRLRFGPQTCRRFGFCLLLSQGAFLDNGALPCFRFESNPQCIGRALFRAGARRLLDGERALQLSSSRRLRRQCKRGLSALDGCLLRLAIGAHLRLCRAARLIGQRQPRSGLAGRLAFDHGQRLCSLRRFPVRKQACLGGPTRFKLGIAAMQCRRSR